jgi:hypothetical protein
VNGEEMSPISSGMSLVGLLMTVVILGLLMVAAIVGLKSINGGGSAAGPAASAIAASKLGEQMSGAGSQNVAGVRTGPACNATADAARAANNLYYATHAGAFPSRWSDLTASASPLVTLPRGATINVTNPRELDGPGWKATMSGGATSSPTFSCR